MPEQAMSLVMMGVLFGGMYFLMIRPQRKKDKATKLMRDSLSSGDEIITIGGIHGKVVKVNDEIITLELNHGKQRINFSKWAVGSVLKKGKDTKKDDYKEEIEELPETNDEDKKDK